MPLRDEQAPGAAAMLERVLTDVMTQGDGNDDIRIRILDAAREQFSRIGIRHSSMEDVARLANVARITVYRRFPTKDDLVEAVTLREFRKYFDQFLIDIKDAETVSDRVVLGFVSSLRAMRNNRVLGGLLTADPHVLASSMIGDNGQMIAVVRQFVAGQLRQEQATGNVAAGVDVDLVAEMMVRVSASFLAIPSGVVDVDDDEEMANLARWFLVPLIEPPA